MADMLDTYNGLLSEVFDSVSNAVGVHVLVIVLEHARWTTKHTYEEADLIQFSEDRVSLDALSAVDRARAEAIARDFMMAVVATLGRLVGKQLAVQLTNQFIPTDEVS